MRSRKGVGKGRVSQWWVILAVVVMFLGSPAGTLKAVTVSFIAERDQTRLAAERAFAEAERLADQKNVDAIRQAIAKYAEAARLYHTLGERGKVAECVLKVGVLYLLLGNVYSDLGEKQKALEYYTQALAIIRAVGDRAGEATRSTTSAWCTTISARSRRRWSTTLRRWPSSVPWGIGQGEATTLNNIGAVYSDLGEKQKALEYFTQALALVAPWGIGPGKPDAQQYRQGVLRSRREAEGAGVLHSGAGHLSAPWGIGPRKPRTLNNIGAVYADLGEKQKALEYYTQALALRRAVGDRAGEATTLNNIGAVYFDLGEKQKALEYYTQALALHRAVGDRAGEFRTLIYMMRLVNDDLGEKQNPRRR
jgi:tetratricopeptide (TPR) repeat protein